MFYEQQGLFQGEKNLEKRGNIQSILRVNSEIALSARKNKENRHDSVSSHPKSPCVKRLSRCWITFVKANEEKLDRKYIQKEEMLPIFAFVHLLSNLPITHMPNSRPLAFREPFSSGINGGNTMPWGFCHLKPLHQME